MTDAKDLFQRNLDFFKRINPPLAERLTHYEPLSEIVYDDDGEPDIVMQGARVYGKGADKFAAEQVEKYWKEPITTGFQNMDDAPLDQEGAAFRGRLLQYAEENDIQFSPVRTGRQAYHLIVMGMGLGAHLPALLEEVKPRNLILIEPNFEFFYHSTCHFDWSAALMGLLEDEVKVHILTETRSNLLIKEFRQIYSNFGRANYDGMTIYRHYENPLFTKLQDYIGTEGGSLFSGLGFFEDELNMIANTYQNLQCGEERVFVANAEPQPLPIFVVGSGPSLDSSLDVIAANQDKAIIVSCGTALLPLLKAGIQPDFQAELERSAHQEIIPMTIAKDYDLSDICLLGSSTLVQGVKKAFAKRIYYFRHMLSSFPAFSGVNWNCLRYPGPTVGNTGSSFAQDMGFRKIYFFGVDMGFVDSNAHHSEGTLYREKGTKYSYQESTWETTLMGNFGGVVKSTNVFRWMLDTLQHAIANTFMGVHYYNCSDGAFVEGTVPLLPEFVDLPEPKIAKKDVVEKIVQSCSVYTKDTFDEHWRDGQLVADIRAVGQKVISCIQSNPDLATKKYMSELPDIMPYMTFDRAAVQILRGSFYMITVIGEYYLDRTTKRSDKEKLVACVREEYCRAVEAMCDEAEAEFSHLEKSGTLLNRETDWGV